MEETYSAIILQGFKFPLGLPPTFGRGLKNVLEKIEFLKRNEDGTFVVAFPKSYDDDSNNNPTQFLFDYTMYEGILHTPVIDSAVKQKAETHSVAHFDLANFVSELKDHFSSSRAQVAHAPQINALLDQLVEKAKSAKLMPDEEFDAYISQAVNEIAQRRARHAQR